MALATHFLLTRLADKVSCMHKAFTLIEALVVIAILAVVASFASVNLISFGKNANQDNSKVVVEQALRQAQSNSMANINDVSWGLHLAADQAVIFSGSSFNPADSQNQVKLLSSGSTLNWTLDGGGDDILFDQGKSSTNDFGQITINSGANSNSTVTINSEGMIE